MPYRNEFPECPRCQCDIDASNERRDMPKYLVTVNKFGNLGTFDARDGCAYCIDATVKEVAVAWVNEGAFEDVSRLLAEYVGLVPA